MSNSNFSSAKNSSTGAIKRYFPNIDDDSLDKIMLYLETTDAQKQSDILKELKSIPSFKTIIEVIGGYRDFNKKETSIQDSSLIFDSFDNIFRESFKNLSKKNMEEIKEKIKSNLDSDIKNITNDIEKIKKMPLEEKNAKKRQSLESILKNLKEIKESPNKEDFVSIYVKEMFKKSVEEELIGKGKINTSSIYKFFFRLFSTEMAGGQKVNIINKDGTEVKESVKLNIISQVFGPKAEATKLQAEQLKKKSFDIIGVHETQKNEDLSFYYNNPNNEKYEIIEDYKEFNFDKKKRDTAIIYNKEKFEKIPYESLGGDLKNIFNNIKEKINTKMEKGLKLLPVILKDKKTGNTIVSISFHGKEDIKEEDKEINDIFYNFVKELKNKNIDYVIFSDLNHEPRKDIKDCTICPNDKKNSPKREVLSGTTNLQPNKPSIDSMNGKNDYQSITFSENIWKNVKKEDFKKELPPLTIKIDTKGKILDSNLLDHRIINSEFENIKISSQNILNDKFLLFPKNTLSADKNGKIFSFKSELDFSLFKASMMIFKNIINQEIKLNKAQVNEASIHFNLIDNSNSAMDIILKGHIENLVKNRSDFKALNEDNQKIALNKIFKIYKKEIDKKITAPASPGDRRFAKNFKENQRLSFSKQYKDDKGNIGKIYQTHNENVEEELRKKLPTLFRDINYLVTVDVLNVISELNLKQINPDHIYYPKTRRILPPLKKTNGKLV